MGLRASGGPPTGVAALIDHTLLAPTATRADIEALCDEAARHHFATVCVNPTWVRLCAHRLRESGVGVCSVVGFPLGATTSDVKAYETQRVIFDGATEVDMVINVGALKSGDLRLVAHDIEAVTGPCRAAGVVSKVIIEAVYLTDDEKVSASTLARAAAADFVKTSTGFGPGGATAADVALMRRTVGDAMGVKAAGGVRGSRIPSGDGGGRRQPNRRQRRREDRAGVERRTANRPGQGLLIGLALDRRRHERDLDLLVLERFLDPAAQFARDIPLTLRDGLHPDADRHAGLADVLDACDLDGRQDRGLEGFILLERLPGLFEHADDLVRVVALVHEDVQDRKGVVLGEVRQRRDGPARDDDPGAPRIAEHECAQRDGLDEASDAVDLRDVADAHLVLEDQEEPRDDVLDQRLGAESDRQPEDARAGEESDPC